MNGCSGAWVHAYTQWFAKDGGIAPHETSYPYLGKYPKLNCKKASGVKKWNSGAKLVKGIYDWRCNEDKLKKLVYEKGAVLVGVYASDSSFSAYNGQGVYDACTSVRAKHLIVVNKTQSETLSLLPLF